MKNAIVSDTTCLIILEKLNRIDLLCCLFENVFIPKIVLSEWLAGSENDDIWLKQFECIKPVNVSMSSRLETLLLVLDQGEAHAIELACVKHLPLIIDEAKGRKIASQLEINVIGFAGIVIQACRVEIISFSTAKSLVNDAVSFGFRISSRLLNQVMDELESLNNP